MLDKQEDRISAWVGKTVEPTPAARAAAEAVTRRWCEGAGLGEAAIVEVLAMLGIGDGGEAT